MGHDASIAGNARQDDADDSTPANLSAALGAEPRDLGIPDPHDAKADLDQATEESAGHGAGSGPIVVLDSTVFVADPACSSTAWRVLAQATRAWGVRVIVPSVVFAEAVGGYRRRAEEALVGFNRWASKHGNRQLGFDMLAADTVDAIKAKVNRFEAELRTKLSDLGAEIVRTPEVAHDDLVARAVVRRRPCDSKGDGYRDTLNWFTVLTLLADTAAIDADVLWVSDNHGDFGADNDVSDVKAAPGTRDGDKGHGGDVVGALEPNASSGRRLHEHLVEDLAIVSAEERLTWVLSLADAVAHLAAQRTGIDRASTPAIYEALEQQALLTFVTEVAFAHLVGSNLPPEPTALPTATVQATVADLENVGDLTYKASTLANDAAVVEFSAKADVLIAALLPTGHQSAEGWTVLAEDETGITIAVAKMLVLTGIVEVDAFGRPISGELSSVRARDDDPGRLAWAARRAARAARPLNQSMEAVRLSMQSSEAIRKAMQGIDVSALDAVRKAMEPSEAIAKAMKGIDVSALDAVRKAMEPSEAIAKAMKGIDVSALDAVRKAMEPSEAIAKAIQGIDLSALNAANRVLDQLRFTSGTTSTRASRPSGKGRESDPSADHDTADTSAADAAIDISAHDAEEPVSEDQGARAGEAPQAPASDEPERDIPSEDNK